MKSLQSLFTQFTISNQTRLHNYFRVQIYNFIFRIIIRMTIIIHNGLMVALDIVVLLFITDLHVHVRIVIHKKTNISKPNKKKPFPKHNPLLVRVLTTCTAAFL